MHRARPAPLPLPARTRAPRSPRGLHAALLLAACLLATIGAGTARATTVTGLAATHRDGQTFLTWMVPPGTGWTYRVYARAGPIQNGPDLAGATLLGSVGDSTWCDRRLSAIRGVTYGFAIDSAGVPLAATQGLFVATPVAAAARGYAVTATASGGGEDLTVVPGVNALAAAVAESSAPVRPVYQRTLDVGGTAAEIFTLWTHATDMPSQPATASRPSLPYDCALVRGGAAPNHALFLRGHGRGLHFLVTLAGSSALDWRLSIDDWLPNEDIATFYFGYHEGYDPTATGNLPPASGTVRGYTHARVMRLLDWVTASFPVDAQRVYAVGGSMGGSFATFLALLEPERIAAVLARVPKLDLADLTDSTLGPATFFPLWGAPASALPCDAGMTAYQRMNAAWLAAADAARDVPPMLTFSGRNDNIVGWHEKPPFYDATRAHRLAAYHFWDQRTHDGSGGFDLMQDNAYLLRFRLDRSFPAFTNASCDGDYGDGSPAGGDTLGTVNGFLEWDTAPVDLPDRWEIRLATRALATRWGTLAAPESASVDVTPRRLQAFAPVPGQFYEWSVRRLPGATVIQSGVVQADGLGLVTIPGVRVLGTGSWLRVKTPGPAGVSALAPVAAAPRLALDRSPLVGRGTVRVTWAGTGEAGVTLLDVAGRRVREVFAGPASGTTAVALDAAGLAAGVYMVEARQGGARACRRVVVLP